MRYIVSILILLFFPITSYGQIINPSGSGSGSSTTISDDRIINGDFLVDQRQEFGASVTPNNGYVNDMWSLSAAVNLQNKLTFQIQSTVAPVNFKNAIKVSVATATTPGNSDNVIYYQPIEGSMMTDFSFGTANAKNIIVSFQAQASVTGTYYISLHNNALNRTYIASYVVASANTWAAYSISIPGDTSGTWAMNAGTAGLYLEFDLGSGSTFNGTSNAWQNGNLRNSAGAVQLVANAAATLYIANVQLYPATSASASYVPRPWVTEREMCRRYFQKTFPEGTAPAQNAGVAGALTVKNPIALGDPSEYIQFSPNMAKSPTIITYNPSSSNANWRDITASADATVSVDPSTTKGTTGVIVGTSGTVATLGDVLAIHVTADSGL